MGWWCTDQKAYWGFGSKICWIFDGLDRISTWWWIHFPSETWYWLMLYLIHVSVNLLFLPFEMIFVCALSTRCTISPQLQRSCEDNIQKAFPCVCSHISLSFSEDSESEGGGSSKYLLQAFYTFYLCKFSLRIPFLRCIDLFKYLFIYVDPVSIFRLLMLYLHILSSSILLITVVGFALF